MSNRSRNRTKTLRVEVDTFIGYAVAWPTLNDRELEDAVAELGEWVAWLTLRYGLDHRTVPPCWAEHGALIEELSALHTAWQRAFSPDAAGDAPLAWHASFAAARLRLAEWVARTGCRATEHRVNA